MPPKKKDLASSPVYGMEHNSQVDLLAQALLREFMHKRGFLDTLRTFDEENPRDGNTISSRALMSDLMSLDTDTQSRMKENGAATIMEMICRLRAEKRIAFESKIPELRRRCEQVVPEIPDKYESALRETVQRSSGSDSEEGSEEGEEEEEEDRGSSEHRRRRHHNHHRKEDRKHRHSRDGDMSGGKRLFNRDDSDEEERGHGDDGEYEEQHGRRHRTSLEKKSRKKKGSVDEFGQPKRRKRRSDADDVAEHMTGNGANEERLLTIDELLEQGNVVSKKKVNTATEGDGGKHDEANGSTHRKSGEPTSSSSSVAAAQHEERENGDSWRLKNINRRADGNAWGNGTSSEDDDAGNVARNAHNQSASEEEDGDEEEESDDDNDQNQANEAHPHQERIGDAVALALHDALLGSEHRMKSVPLSYLQHGFFFSKHIQYGLVQRNGGPCGVLAPIQSHLLANRFLSSSHSSASATECLIDALTEIILRAQPDPTRVVIVVGDPEIGTTSDIANLTRNVGFSTEDDVRRRIASLMGREWCRPKGGGLINYILSVMLSRSLSDIERDMDMPSPLVDTNGYCTQELTNLFLCGKSVSGVHDGTMTHGSTSLHGFDASLRCGFLSYLESLGHHKVGMNGKHPKCPVWVIYHESHYSVLFMKKDSRDAFEEDVETEGQGKCDLFYWDQLGEQDEEIRLTVTVSREKGPPGRKAGALVPFLDDIIRTLPGFENSRVNWNGIEPLL